MRPERSRAKRVEAYLEILEGISIPVDCTSINLRKFWLYTEIELAAERLAQGHWQAAISRSQWLPKEPCPWSAGWLAQWHVELSKSFLRGGKQDLAQEHVQAAWELARNNLRVGLLGEAPVNRSGVIEAYTAHARYLVATSFPDEAIQVLNELLNVRFPTRNQETEQAGIAPKVVARIRVMMGLVHAQKAYRNVPGAEAQARIAYNLAVESKDISFLDLFSAHTRLAHLDLEAGDATAAQLHLEAIRDHAQTSTLRPRDRAWYSSLWQRVMRETLGESYPPFKADCQALLDQWDGEAETGSVGFMQYGRLREVQVEAIAAALDLEGPEQALRTALVWQDLGLLNQRLAPETWTMAGLRDVLGTRDALLVFAGGKSSLYGFLIRKSGDPLAWKVAQARQAKASVTVLAESLANVCAGLADPETLHLQASAVCELLFPSEIQKQLASCHNLVVLGRYQAERVPLELLPIQGQPLGLRTAICDWPTPSLGLALTRESQTPLNWKSWVHLGEPELHPAAIAMDAAVVPLLAPQALRSNDQLVDLVGPDARYAKLREQSGATVLQIVSHGLQLIAGEWNSAIATTADEYAPRGILAMRTLVEDLGFTAPPITLLGICRSQRGPKRFGDVGATQLGGAFLMRGSRAVLGSRADCVVYLDSTYQLHESIKASLADGERLDRALLIARQEMSSKGLHAGHWASLQILGAGQTHLTPFVWDTLPNSASPWKWAGAVFLLLGAGGWLIWNRKRSRASSAA